MRTNVYLLTFLILIVVGSTIAQTHELLYQGRLVASGTPAHTWHDFEFRLCASEKECESPLQTKQRLGVPVSNGLFSVKLDFEPAHFNGDNDRWLEIAVRPAGGGTFATLSPSQKITSSPFAIKSLNSAKLGGVAANEFVKTDDSRLSDARNPLPNSSNYIQNGTSPQLTSNFSITGSGDIGTNLRVGNSAEIAGVLQAGGSINSNGNITAAGNLTGNHISTTSLSTTNANITGNTTIAGNSLISGSLGVGTPPAAKLHVSGTGIIRARINSDSNSGVALTLNNQPGWSVATVSGGQFQIFNDATGSNALWIDSTNRVGIGTAAPDQLLSVNGSASKIGGGSWDVFSDERLKNVSTRFTRGGADLMRLNPVRFEYKRDNALGLRGEGEYIGFSAQEVQRVVPEAVTRSTNGYLQINNDPILWTMLNSIKEQQSQIDNQQQQNKSLQEQNRRQQEQINALKKILCDLKPKAAICREEEK